MINTQTLPLIGVWSANWLPHHTELRKSTLVRRWVQFGGQVNKRFIQSCPIHCIYFTVSNLFSGSPVCSFTCCVLQVSHIHRLHAVPKNNHGYLHHILNTSPFMNKNIFIHHQNKTCTTQYQLVRYTVFYSM